MSNTAEYIIQISARGDRMTAEQISRVQEKLEAADQSASRFAASVSTGVSRAFLKLGVGLVAVTKLGMQAEKTSMSFNVLAGSEANAVKTLSELNKYADNSIFTRNTVQDAAKTMLGFGVSAETVADDLKLIGDVAMGDKDKLQQIARVYGQITSAGKLQGRTLQDLIRIGYNPLLDISALTGKSVATLKDEMSKGLITADQVRAAFERATGSGGKFNNMTERLSQTTFGAWSRLKGKFLGTILEIYDFIQPYLVPAFNMLGKGLDWVANAAKWVSDNFQNILAVAVPLTAAIVAYNVATKIGTFITTGFVAILKVLNFVMNLNPVGLIVAGIAALTAAVVVCWNKFAGFRAVILTVWETTKGFGQILKTYVLDRIRGILTGVGKLGDALGKLFKGDFTGAWDAAKGAASSLLGIDAKRNAAASTKQLVGGIRNTYNYTLANERAKDRAKQALKTPEAAGGVADIGGAGTADPVAGAASSGKLASDIATGGTRNTSITINISKFFDDVNITTASSTDMRKLQDTILEGINRSLEIATSAAR